MSCQLFSASDHTVGHVFFIATVQCTACSTPTHNKRTTQRTNKHRDQRQEPGMMGFCSPASLQAHPCPEGSTSDLPSAVLASLIDYPLSQLAHSQLTALACTSLCVHAFQVLQSRPCSHPTPSSLLPRHYRVSMEAIYSCLLNFGGHEPVCPCMHVCVMCACAMLSWSCPI